MRPVNKLERDYVLQAQTVVAALQDILDEAPDSDGTEQFFLDAARGYVTEAQEWVDNADELNWHEHDMLRRSVAVAHYTVNQYLQVLAMKEAARERL